MAAEDDFGRAVIRIVPRQSRYDLVQNLSLEGLVIGSASFVWVARQNPHVLEVDHASEQMAARIHDRVIVVVDTDDLVV